MIVPWTRTGGLPAHYWVRLKAVQKPKHWELKDQGEKKTLVNVWDLFLLFWWVCLDLDSPEIPVSGACFERWHQVTTPRGRKSVIHSVYWLSSLGCDQCLSQPGIPSRTAVSPSPDSGQPSGHRSQGHTWLWSFTVAIWILFKTSSERLLKGRWAARASLDLNVVYRTQMLRISNIPEDSY